MNHKVTIELPENVYLPLAEAATRRGSMVEDVIVDKLRAESAERETAANDATAEGEGLSELLKFAGYVSHSENSGDNEKIDRDLAEAYADTHDEQK